MKTRNFVLSLAAACALAAGAAGAANTADASSAPAAPAPAAQDGKTFTHEAGGITFDLPDGWEAETEGNQLVAAPAGGGISISFWVTEEDDFEDATKELGEELGKHIQNLKFDGEPKEGTHNGMPHVAVSGTGQVQGKDVLFSADLVAAKKPVIILTVASADNLQKHQADYIQLVKSIKKVG